MWAGCMRGLNNPFPSPVADDVHRRFGLGPPSLLLREAPWKKVPKFRIGSIYFDKLRKLVQRNAKFRTTAYGFKKSE